jgi:response regulator RpfG family c-di-GMP phosphodiesterase
VRPSLGQSPARSGKIGMSQQTPQSPRWRIVATDDDPKLLAKVTYALRDAGHIVFAAYNGDTARQLACNTPELDLLITNTRLHDVSAPELIRQVREARPTLAILHIGEPLPDVPSLREPVSPEALLGAVTALLQT